MVRINRTKSMTEYLREITVSYYCSILSVAQLPFDYIPFSFRFLLSLENAIPFFVYNLTKPKNDITLVIYDT